MVDRAVTGDTAARKAALRKHVLACRDALTPEYRASASRAILIRVCGIPAYEQATTVLGYFGFGTEIDTRPFLAHALSAGKILLLPRVDRAARSLRLYRVRDLDSDLVSGIWGIREPARDRCDETDPQTVDFVLMPGVAFTHKGERLGYGGGFYDRLIPQMTRPPVKIAPAFGCQVVDSLPMTETDQRIDQVVSESPADDTAAIRQLPVPPGTC
jgi:5-formyltetrahydrofolate cyclo-ligase